MYAPYPQPNTPVVKLLYRALRAGTIERREFAACMQLVMTPHRETPGPQCAWCEATEELRADRHGQLWCLTCAVRRG
jgi:hypothetical protein